MGIVRLSKSCVGEEEKLALAEVIDAGFLGMGVQVQKFEEEIRTFLGSGLEVICVNTGTSALHLALQCLGIGSSDEVLVPSITYVASFQAISATGAKPVACDVSLDRVFIDLNDAEQRITSRTKAIMPVHYASDSQGIPAVYEFASRHGLRVIEDAAHAFGCLRNGVKIGVVGDVICFSFDGIKNITSGEGGVVVTGDRLLAERIRDARLLGVERDTEKRYRGDRSWDFDVSFQGFRFHMSNLMAAIGREQLKKLPVFAAKRRELASRYCYELKNVPHLQILDLNWSEIVPHIFVVRVLDGYRNGLMDYLVSRQIQCGFHYLPNHLLSYYQDPLQQKLPMAEKLGTELVSLPLHAELTQEEQSFVIQEVLSFLGEKNV